MPHALEPLARTLNWVRHPSALRLAVIALALAAVPTGHADGQTAPDAAWSFQTSAILTGTSLRSEPDGYKVYTALALEVGVTRELRRSLRLRLTGALESREVELLRPDVPKVNLGSLEMLPLNAVVEWHPRQHGRWRPYVGAGVNASVFWEKSGALDSMRVAPSVGPTVALGFEVPLRPATFFVVGYKWNRLTTTLDVDGVRQARLEVHPSTFSAGVAFRF
jgi:outer membrane protein W